MSRMPFPTAATDSAASDATSSDVDADAGAAETDEAAGEETQATDAGAAEDEAPVAAADGMTNLLIVVSAQNEADGLGASVEAAAQTIASEAALTAFDAMSGATVDDAADAVFAGG